MSCTLRPIAAIAQLEKICQYLDFNESFNGETILPDDCLTAISPLADILVIARYQHICVLSSHWDATDSGDDQFQFNLSWNRNICHSDKETITSLIVLPVAAANNKSKKVYKTGPEWTCIAVGFSSGYIRFYSDNGHLLLSHLLHNEPISRLKCQSYTPPRHSSEPEQQEELHAFHLSVLCVLPGFPLFSTLKAARNHYERASTDGGEQSQIDTPLTFHKWRFTEQLKISDCVVVGSAPTNTYHHLLTASLCGGFSTAYKTCAPQSTQVIATGTKPFVGYHFAMEGSGQLILTDVAKVVANKLKSAIGQAVPSWFLGGSSKQNVSTEEHIEPADDMGCRFGLCDSSRQGIDIILSPLNTSCVVTDFLGRISLIDTNSGVAVRLWKGYRDVQCGWLVVEEEVSKSKSLKRMGLCLVMYSPKQNTIEIWAMQQGPRIASFSLTQPGRLLYTSHNLMGMSSSNVYKHKAQLPVLFLGSNGVLMEVAAPFHCILTEKNSIRARDLHLLKKLRSALRDHSSNESKLIDEVTEVASKLSTIPIIKEALGYLMNSSHLTPNLLTIFLNHIQDTFSAEAEKVKVQVEASNEKDDGDKRELLVTISFLLSLTNFYEYICSIHNLPPNYTCVVDSGDTADLEELSKNLALSKKELNRVSSTITSSITNDKNSTGANKKSVTFSTRSKDSNYIEYLKIFHFPFLNNEKELKDSKQKKMTQEENSKQTQNKNNKIDSLIEQNKVNLDPNCSYDQMVAVSNIMYQGVIYGTCELRDFMDQCNESLILEEDLVKLALTYWSNKDHGSNIFREMIQFSNLLKCICAMRGTCDETWWKTIQHQLSECSNPLSAMTGALICRGVAVQWEAKLDKVDDDIDWDTYEQDTCQWSLLIGQLEDISVLDKTISNVIITDEEFTITNNNLNVTLKSILKQGRGCVTELVAKWLCSCGFNPEFVVDRNDTEFSSLKNSISPNKKNRVTGVAEGIPPHIEESHEAKSMTLNESIVSERVKCLKQHFPYSLTCSSLLANMCWEYIQAFERCPHRLGLFKAALLSLSHIQSSHIKQGVCYLLWTDHLRGKYESCLRLLHKVGKVPKELLCKQDLQLSDSQIGPFLQLYLLFFEYFIEANMMTEVSERPKIRHELFWEGQTRHSPTFVQLSLTQPPANYDSLHLLLQATNAFNIMVVFNLRLSKPLNSFFDSVSQSAIFADIHSKSMLTRINPDAKLIESRTKFLIKAISAAITLIETDLNPDGEIVYNTTKCIFWVSKILDLAGEWSVPSDPLRRHQVCELYMTGYDQLAQEITPLVSEIPLLGSQLLLILGIRLKVFLMVSKNTDLKESLSCLSPAVISWLDTIKISDDMKVNTPNLQTIAELSKSVIKLLPEDHKDRHMSNILTECLPQLSNDQSTR